MTTAGFAVSTIFHYEHLKHLYRTWEDALFVLFSLDGTEHTTKIKNHLHRSGVRYCHVKELCEKNIHLDVLYSVYWMPSFIVLGPEVMHVRVMYGYAKDEWNYGSWNRNYDLIFTYGPYAEEKLCDATPCISAGHPRLPIRTSHYAWRSGRKKLLYCPTYGERSSLPEFDAIVPQLTNDYEITVKLHHLTDIAFCPNLSEFQRAERIRVLDESHDLFDLIPDSDLVISDHSGAIFDAMLHERKILLIDPKPMKERIAQELNSDEGSLDIKIRTLLPHCEAERLPEAISDALAAPIGYKAVLPKLFSGMGTEVPQNIRRHTADRLQRFDRKNRQTALLHRFHRFVSADRRKLVICGAGEFGQSILCLLKSQQQETAFYVDSDASKQETGVNGIPVISPDQLAHLTPAGHKCLIATVGGGPFYERKLRQFGFEKDIDYICLFQQE